MPDQLIQVSLFVPCIEWMNYSTTYNQDSDSKFYDDKAACYFVELYHDRENDQDLALSRTRIEFKNEHFVYADSNYLKSLGSEDTIYSNFCKSQG